MKIAHLAEAFGIDAEIHACGPAHRHCMSAMRNSNYYEVALVGPGTPNAVPPVYKCGYSDQLEAIGKDGCVSGADGAGPRRSVRLGFHREKPNRATRIQIAD